jgi:hypothetical protein
MTVRTYDIRKSNIRIVEVIHPEIDRNYVYALPLSRRNSQNIEEQIRRFKIEAN